MRDVFWASCPDCEKWFIVDGELRHSEYKLICPFCQRHFHADEAHALNERGS